MQMSENVFEATAFAKVNLALHITARRADGYHELESLVVFTEYGDRLTASVEDVDRLTFSGQFGPKLHAAEDNLILKAIALFRHDAPEILPDGLHFHLEKNLPIASGIGGGSADAAATLRLLNQLAGQTFGARQLAKIAQQLGADVPMCLSSNTSLVAGIGEKISSITQMPALHIVLVNPLVPVSTPAIFNALKRTDNAPLPDAGNGFVDVGALGEWLDQTENNLQRPAQNFVPEIEVSLALLSKTEGIILARMSGSGASTFALYASEGAAENANAMIKSAHPNWWAVRSKIR